MFAGLTSLSPRDQTICHHIIDDLYNTTVYHKSQYASKLSCAFRGWMYVHGVIHLKPSSVAHVFQSPDALLKSFDSRA